MEIMVYIDNNLLPKLWFTFFEERPHSNLRCNPKGMRHGGGDAGWVGTFSSNEHDAVTGGQLGFSEGHSKNFIGV